jgi:hypothetical protein
MPFEPLIKDQTTSALVNERINRMMLRQMEDAMKPRPPSPLTIYLGPYCVILPGDPLDAEKVWPRLKKMVEVYLKKDHPHFHHEDGDV